MRDREIFHSAVRELPSLMLPLLVTFGTAQLLEYGSTVLYAKLMSPFLLLNKDGLFVAAVVGLFLLGLFFSVIGCLVTMGCYRLCLERGLRKQGRMPWSVFGQWRRYKSWILWAGVLPFCWKVGRNMIFQPLLHYWLDTETLLRLYQGKSYFNIVVVILLDPVLLMLLNLSVRMAYLRAPQRGFWRAVLFGIKEGFKKWPKTIGPQLKFVVPIIFGINLVCGLLFQINILTSMPLLLEGIRQLLLLTRTVWILVFYGFLTAERYDPPEEANRNFQVEDEGCHQGE